MGYEPEGYVLYDPECGTQTYVCGMTGDEVARAVAIGMELVEVGPDGGRSPATVADATAAEGPAEASWAPDDGERWQAVLGAVEALADATGTQGAAQAPRAAVLSSRAAASDPVAEAVERLRAAVGGATEG